MQKHFKIVVFLFFTLGFPFSGESQTPISGVINQYTKVVSVDAVDMVTVNSVAAFQVKDTVLIIQMKGVEILDPVDLPNFGFPQHINNAGKYEFLIISVISGNQITFTADLLGNYNPDGLVQLIKVPSYDEAKVDGVLTGNVWNPATGTGGVLAFIVNKTLTLEADIDMSAKGFKGALTVNGDGLCADTDINSYNDMYFDEASLMAARKGEGSATYNSVPALLGTAYSKGRGAIFQGGGGGNGHLSGGGGGANIGNGGLGGREANTCTTPADIGGRGGWHITSYANWASENRIFMGGGGGAGTQSVGFTASNGADGGGIVIILADTILVNIPDVTIRSNGENASVGAATGGGGGGGAGGAIIVSVDNIGGTGNLHMETKGGNGGVVNCTGPGGGGGGGLIWYSNSTNISVIDTILDGGSAGIDISGCALGGFPGSDGRTEPDLVLPLNGFLFNTIYSSVTFTNTDTICEGDIPSLLLGTKPKGGTPPYDYEWESSTDKLVWNTEAQGALIQNYTPSTPLVDTTYFRRTIRDTSIPIITDISKVLTIIVQPKIENNLITFIDTLCSLVQPDTIFASPKLTTGGNGPGSYTYLWEKSLDDGTTWMDTIQSKDKYYYVPPVMDVAIITDVYYRRIVSSGIGCPDTSTSGKVIYLPQLVNEIYTKQWICDGEQPGILTTDPTDPVSGGSGNYVYKWYESDNGIDTIPGVIGTTVFFNPPALSNGTSSDKSYFYFRKIISGACEDLSNSVEIVVHPLISGNTITADQTICKGFTPIALTGSEPPVLAGGEGAGTYTYQWLESADDILYADIAGATGANYSPGNLDVKYYYRREVTSTFVNGSNNVCIDTTAIPVVIDIHPTYTSDLADLSAGQDTVCYGTQGKLSLTLVEAIPGSNGPWTILLDDSDGNTWPSFSSNGTEDIFVDANHSFSGTTTEATIQYTFNSITDQFGCVPDPVATEPGSIVIIRPPVAIAGGNQIICGLGTNLNGTLGFGTGLWTGPIEIVFTDQTDPTTQVTASNQGVYTLTWTTSNGLCPDATDLADYSFWDTPSAALIIPDVTDTTLAAFIKDFSLYADAYLTGDINWTFNFGGGNFSASQGVSTIAQSLESGENEIQLTISSGGGDCPEFDQTDVIRVIVQEDPFISKGMSPEDKTGGNDYFYIENIENVENELTIFNKLGTILFQIDNYSCSMVDDSNCWDGRDKNNNPLPDGTYYYVLKILGSNSQTVTGYFIIKGN